MWSAAALVDALAPDPCARHLATLLAPDADRTMTWFDTLTFDIALTAVPVTDGLLILSVDAVDPDQGWEHYDLAASFLVPLPPGWPELAAAFRTLRGYLTTQISHQPVMRLAPVAGPAA